MKLTLGFKPSPADKRDQVASLKRLDKLPILVDLKPDVFEVEDQGQFSSCTANSSCSALEMLYKHNKTPYDLSRMYLYYFTRQLGKIKGDNGAYLRDVGKALTKYGVCQEASWAYVKEHLDTPPSIKAVAEGDKFKILSYQRLMGISLYEIRNSIAQGVPVLLAMPVHEGMYGLKGDWKTHSWNYSGANLGWHAVLCIGYDDESKHLLIENSWGAGWGDGGFFGLPYDMVTKGVTCDYWILNPNLNINVKKKKSVINKIIDALTK
jgi:C1A family cysteine protease